MIKKTTFIALLTVALFTGGILFQAFYPTESNARIEDLLTQEISMPRHEEKFPNKQMRKGVAKDLWITESNGTRLHHHIESPRSILTAIPHGDRVELIEQMIGMKCFFQEKIEESGGETIQHIRFIQSGEGTYRYTDQFFDAQRVYLALYQLPGDTLMTKLSHEEAYLRGVAEAVSLSFSSGSPNFHAEKFKAQIRPQGNAP